MTENTSLTKVAKNLDAKIENSVSRMEKIEEKFPSLPIDEQELVRVSNFQIKTKIFLHVMKNVDKKHLINFDILHLGVDKDK